MIDYFIVTILWAIVDNIVSIHVPAMVMVLGPALLFCAYFGITEGTQERRASLGKRVTGLEVVRRDGGEPSLKDISVRSAVLAAILIFDWERLTTSILNPADIPSAILALIWSVPAGLILCNILLASRSNKGILIQDGLTFTEVVSTDIFRNKEGGVLEHFLPERRPEWPRPVLSIIVFALCYAAGLAVLMASGFGQVALGLGREIESNLYRELKIRNRVNIDPATTWHRGDGKARTITISVWVPYVVWNEMPHELVAESAVAPIQLEPGYYESGSVRVWTGFDKNLFSLTRSTSYALNLPEEGNAEEEEKRRDESAEESIARAGRREAFSTDYSGRWYNADFDLYLDIEEDGTVKLLRCSVENGYVSENSGVINGNLVRLYSSSFYVSGSEDGSVINIGETSVKYKHAAEIPGTCLNDAIDIVETQPSSPKAGTATTFKVRAAYRLVSAESGEINIGFNTVELSWFHLFNGIDRPDDKRIFVEKGVGNVSFTIEITPVDWGDPEGFRVQVNLSEDPHPSSWRPLASDTEPIMLSKNTD